MTQEDTILVRRAAGGDREAYRRLLEAHYGMMFRVAYRYTGHRQDAEDIAQDVCVRLVHKLGSFRGTSSFTTWLYRVVVNACRDMQKHRGVIKRSEDSFRELEALGQEEQRDGQRQVAWLYRAIYSLEPSLKETALLVLAEELSHAEAADILGCKESTVSWRMHALRKQLKEVMGSYHDRP